MIPRFPIQPLTALRPNRLAPAPGRPFIKRACSPNFPNPADWIQN